MRAGVTVICLILLCRPLLGQRASRHQSAPVSSAQTTPDEQIVRQQINDAKDELSRVRAKAQERAETTSLYLQAKARTERAKEAFAQAQKSGTRQRREESAELLDEAQRWQEDTFDHIIAADPRVEKAQKHLDDLQQKLDELRSTDILDSVKKPEEVAVHGWWSFHNNDLHGKSDDERAAIWFPANFPTGTYVLRVQISSGYINGWLQLAVPVGEDNVYLIQFDRPERLRGYSVVEVLVDPADNQTPVRVLSADHATITPHHVPTGFEDMPRRNLALAMGQASVDFASIRFIRCDSAHEFARFVSTYERKAP